ncbi:UNVERIFIED_CONTAM: putative F-box protein [Sesamum latifolium]|uniref:F-box protein n=1 Tax=Sesamum latifolium TaxID=2727402 RepID=A0AAW2WPQ5_9LAMI
MVDFFSEEIIINILRRMPVKALLRCTSVCRSWYILITSPEFISTHLNFAADSKKRTPFLLLRRRVRNSERYGLYSDNESFSQISTFEFPFRSINSWFTIVGCCNGLLCLSDDRVYYMHTVILWNPCIKKSVLLPKPNLIYSSYGSFIQTLGFGFDPIASDYKVIRITYVDSGRGLPQVELYRLSTGVWQDLSFLALEYVICNRSRQAYVNGATHWIARCTDCYDLIVLFDMCGEVFREMMLPVSLADNDSMRSKDLVVYKESLAVIVWSVSGPEPGFCLWVMNEYGVEWSWTKHLSIDLHEFGRGYVRPLWIRKHGEVITVWQDGRLIAYDHDGAEVKDLGVRGSRSEDYRRSVHVDGYMKSLVLLEKGSCFSDAVTRTKLPALQTDDCDSIDVGSNGSDCEHSSESDHKHGHGSYGGMSVRQ